MSKNAGMKWWWPKSAKRAIQEHWKAAGEAEGRLAESRYQRERQKDQITRLQEIQDELETETIKLATRAEQAEAHAMAKLEDEFIRARSAHRAYEQATERALTMERNSRAAAENAIDVAVLKLHQHFTRYVATKREFVMNIPAFSVASPNGGRVMVDPDGPIARAVLRRTVELLAEIDADTLPQGERPMRPVPAEVEVPSEGDLKPAVD